MDKVITISREFGSGGRELGVKLADKLGIPFYDKELISMAADDINIAEEAFRHYDEHIVVYDPLDRQYYHAFSDVYQIPMSDQIFVAQSNVIRRLASHGPCIIVGRCADMILTDSLNLFIYAKMKDRIKRMLELESEAESDGKEMERRIREVDRKRKEYYQYYTGNTWGRAQNYHLCLDSGPVGVDGCLKAVLAYLGEDDKI
ncbi:AAA family ATPase [Enterocloster citroniae]|uniref:cytidylate kinase-like family protein n=1 Tax=Enterocloster citroniae TaxID=358743 RepID=UPI001899ECDE|nr:cytidylate kinase-like family protein [Enterocloster citroniae]